jgi:transmembrane sensor|tara:strand:+ start:4275 stop:5213 length:939 start_codon:yes stop_codon:yes gene_type:complete
MIRDERVREEAAQWFAIMRRGATTLEERRAFDRWRADAVNQRALDSMHELWGELAVLRSRPAPIRRHRPDRRAVMAASAVAVLMIGGGALFLPRLTETRVTTGIGEQETRALPDGSVMAVNVDSRVNYAFRERRRIRMDEGEATFFVRKDPQRPFIVTAGAYDVRAVGTAFNVRRRGAAMEVSVSEGVVAIIARDDGRELMRLKAGEMSILPPRPARARPTVVVVPVETVGQWRMRVIEYDDVPVRALIAELNRFYDRPLRITESGLADRRITVRLRVEDRDRTLHTVAGLLDARIEPGPDFDTLVAASPAG